MSGGTREKAAAKTKTTPNSPQKRASRKRVRKPDVPELPELAKVSLAGKFAEEVTIVPGSFSSMVLSSGHLEEEGRFVLLPFMEMSMQGLKQREAPDGSMPSEVETIFSHTLPLENAIWLAFDMLHDFRNSSERLEDMVEGDLRFDPARMTHAIRFAELAAAEAARCAEALRRLSGQVTEEARASD